MAWVYFSFSFSFLKTLRHYFEVKTDIARSFIEPKYNVSCYSLLRYNAPTNCCISNKISIVLFGRNSVQKLFKYIYFTRLQGCVSNYTNRKTCPCWRWHLCCPGKRATSHTNWLQHLGTNTILITITVHCNNLLQITTP